MQITSFNPYQRLQNANTLQAAPSHGSGNVHQFADKFSFSHGNKHDHNHSHGQPTIERSSSQNGAATPTAQVKVAPGVYYDAAADKNAVASYYGDITKLEAESPKELYSSLHDLVTKTHKPLDYAPDTNLYPEVDRHPDGNIYCIYSGGGPMFVGDNDHGTAAIKQGNYNCEHVVPQSWFHKDRVPRGDLHHLYAAQIDCNSHRGNATYAELKGHDDGDYHWADGIVDQKANKFEPTSGKGEGARAVLYFLIRYPGQIGDAKGEYTAKDVEMLKQWAKNDPPTDFERHRNVTIQGKQGNRNPLIDFPELVDKVDFEEGLGAIGKAITA